MDSMKITVKDAVIFMSCAKEVGILTILNTKGHTHTLT